MRIIIKWQKLWKNKSQYIGQSGGLLVVSLRQLLKRSLPLIKNILELLAKNILIPLGLTAAASARDEAID